MPELPEVEHLHRTLEPRITGRRVEAVTLERHDVLHDDGARPGRPARLLRGTTVTALRRHGKQIALIGASGRIVCVHLGMSGQLRWLPAGARLGERSHVHCTWHLAGAAGHLAGAAGHLAGAAGRLVFRDPRRFGGLWTFPSEADLRRDRWGRLGPDALDVSTGDLARRLAGTTRPIKAALLDQALVAGLGNIYVDEALFAAGIHPRTRACSVPRAGVRRLAGVIRPLLRRAISAGGTTLRDYVDADGRDGRAGEGLSVYGRAGGPCVRCGCSLEGFSLAQRTTVACRLCQVLFQD